MYSSSLQYSILTHVQLQTPHTPSEELWDSVRWNYLAVEILKKRFFKEMP